MLASTPRHLTFGGLVLRFGRRLAVCIHFGEGREFVIGDAAHAFTPFFGQGCNSGFEDVSILHDLLTKGGGGGGSGSGGSGGSQLAAVLAAYYSERKPNADAIANMALDNFDEMMSKTADARFLLEKEIENELATRHPAYISRYVLITHSLFPYHLACRVHASRGERKDFSAAGARTAR